MTWCKVLFFILLGFFAPEIVNVMDKFIEYVLSLTRDEEVNEWR